MATIKLGMDASEVISKQEKINQGAKQHGEHAKSFGEQMSHAAEHGLSRALLKCFAIREVLAAAVESMQKLSKDSAEANKKAGGETVQEGANLRTLGVKNVGGMLQAFRNTEGASTLEERQEFLKNLASANRQRRTKFTQKQVSEALMKFARGGSTSFGEGGEDLIKDMERRRHIKTDAQIDQDQANLSPQEREEINTRNFERQQALRKDAAFEGEKGTRSRRAAAMLEAIHAEEETSGVMGFVKGFGRAIVQKAVGADAVGAAEQQGLEQMTDHLGMIEQNTRRRPQLNLTGQSE